MRRLTIFLVAILLFTSIAFSEEGRVLAFGKHLDFGDVAVGDSVTRELTLYNRGDENLTINELYFHENLDGVYSGNFSGVILAGGEQNITITFTPTEKKLYQGLVYVPSDKTNEGDSDRLLTGRGVSSDSGTKILQFGKHLNFGDVLVGESVSRELTVYNRGDSDLTITQLYFHENLDGVYSGNFSGIIPAGEEQNITITFRPTQKRLYSGLVYVVSDRTNDGESSRLLTGYGVDHICDESTAITREKLREMIANAEDVTEVNTCKITDMSYLVSIYKRGYIEDDTLTEEQKDNIKNFNQDISGWDTSRVTDMIYMFSSAKLFNQPIGEWDVSNVTDMSLMFYDAESFNQPIGEWDVSNVTNMYSMFSSDKSFNQPIGEWDVSNVTDMRWMFFYAKSFNQPIGDWDVSNVVDMSWMFSSAESFNQPIGDWDVSNIISTNLMFSDTKSFNQPIGEWDLSNVINMEYMFYGAKSFNQPIGEWDVSNVEFMNDMFSYTESFNQPIGEWDVSNVTNMEYMFQGAMLFNQNIKNWNVDNVRSYENFATDSVLEDKYNPFIF